MGNERTHDVMVQQRNCMRALLMRVFSNMYSLLFTLIVGSNLVKGEPMVTEFSEKIGAGGRRRREQKETSEVAKKTRTQGPEKKKYAAPLIHLFWITTSLAHIFAPVARCCTKPLS